MDVFPKFIIETDDELGDCLIITKCTYHKQIATFPEKVKGGGWFTFVDDEFVFDRSSDDFGPATMEDIRACVESGNVYTNASCLHSIASKYKFFYNTGTELIELVYEPEETKDEE